MVGWNLGYRVSWFSGIAEIAFLFVSTEQDPSFVLADRGARNSIESHERSWTCIPDDSLAHHAWCLHAEGGSDPTRAGTMSKVVVMLASSVAGSQSRKASCFDRGSGDGAESGRSPSRRRTSWRCMSNVGE